MTVTVPAGSLMEASLTGQRVEASLADPSVLAAAARALIDAVAEMGNIPVHPIGRTAALLVGAAAVSSQGSVRQAVLPSAGGADTKVLTVEAVAVGEAALEHAVVQARIGGADWVGAWLWHASPRMSPDRITADEVRFSGYSDIR